MKHHWKKENIIAEGCSLRKAPSPVCDDSKRLVTRYSPPVEGVYLPFTHRNCTHNEEIAIADRVVGKVPLMTTRGHRMLDAEARALKAKLPKTDRLSVQQFCEGYSGPKKTRYLNAAESLVHNPLKPADSAITAFVKAEKFDPCAKKNPPPRVIQARNARFNIEVGRYLKPIEHNLYGLQGRSGLPVMGKCLNWTQRAELLRKKWACFKRPVVYSLDASRFDQHVCDRQLAIEHSVYTHCNTDPYFAKLLAEQLRNRGYTRNGVKYKTKGKRMSGDMNTALGNCLLMLMITRASMKVAGLVNYELMVDGDDTLLLFEEHDEHLLSGISAAFLEFGHEIKLENRATVIERVIWCQSRPINLGDHWTFVPHPRKMLSQTLAGVKYWHEDKSSRNMAYSVGLCHLSQLRGVPILQAFFSSCMKLGSWTDEVMQDQVYKIGRIGYDSEWRQTIKPVEISIETRESFERAYGYSPAEQLLIERTLSAWQLPDTRSLVQQQVRADWFVDPDARCPYWAVPRATVNCHNECKTCCTYLRDLWDPNLVPESN